MSKRRTKEKQPPKQDDAALYGYITHIRYLTQYWKAMAKGVLSEPRIMQIPDPNTSGFVYHVISKRQDGKEEVAGLARTPFEAWESAYLTGLQQGKK